MRLRHQKRTCNSTDHVFLEVSKSASVHNSDSGTNRQENDEAMDDDAYRSVIIHVSRLSNTFTAPEAYDYADISYDPELFVEAPWCDLGAVAIDGVVAHYVHDERWRPGGITVEAMKSWCL